MLFKSVAFAASAAAFLVIPEMSKDDEEIFNILPFEGTIWDIDPTAFQQTVDVPCKQCRGEDAHLKLDFAVEHDTSLTLNGVDVFPVPESGIVADVVAGDVTELAQGLGFNMLVQLEGIDEVQMMDVYSTDLRILSVGGRPTTDIPLVRVKFVVAATGEIMMGDIALEDTDAMPEVPQMGCTSILCRAKAFLNGLTGCKGHKKPPTPEQMEQLIAEGRLPEDARKGHHHHHGGHSHGHHGHHDSPEWSRLLQSVMTHIFMPVLMGVAAGIGVAMYVLFSAQDPD